MARPRRVFRRLAEGGLVLLRPVTPADAEKLKRGFARLSAQSRYRRFLHHLQRLSDADLHRLLDLDQHDRVAWGAIDVLRSEEIGIARYSRSAVAAETAEFAIAVVDAWQRRGVGRALLEQLIESATENGIGQLIGDVLADNHSAIALFRRFGASFARGDRGLLRVAIDVALPASAAQAG